MDTQTGQPGTQTAGHPTGGKSSRGNGRAPSHRTDFRANLRCAQLGVPTATGSQGRAAARAATPQCRTDMDRRCRRQRILRQYSPGQTVSLNGRVHQRWSRAGIHPPVSEARGDGKRQRLAADRDRHSARGGDIATACEHLPQPTGPPHANFKGEITSSLKQRPEGVRLRHTVNGNSVKVYDKQGSVLRVETTIVHPEHFRVYRPAEGDAPERLRWLRLRRGVADLWRRGQVSQPANRRYLEALASVTGKTPLREEAVQVCRV